MSAKVKIHLVDENGIRVGKTTLFITARPALMRWTIKTGSGKSGKENTTYCRRLGVDEYLELTPKETVHVLDWLRQTERSPDELTIDKVAEILQGVHIQSPDLIIERNNNAAQ